MPPRASGELTTVLLGQNFHIDIHDPALDKGPLF